MQQAWRRVLRHASSLSAPLAAARLPSRSAQPCPAIDALFVDGSSGGGSSHAGADGLLRLTARLRAGPLVGTLTEERHEIPLHWLRDHCGCAACVEPSTRQKLHASSDVPLSVVPARAWTEVASDGSAGVLHVEWAPATSPSSSISAAAAATSSSSSISATAASSHLDRAHSSSYDLQWLRSHLSRNRKPDPAAVWDREILLRQNGGAVPAVQHEDLMNAGDPTGLYACLSALYKYGLCFVRNVPREPHDYVGTLATRFGDVRRTFYGPTWNVRSIANARNIAYTSLYLGLHMDLMYFDAPPGLQFLHCLENTVTGGDSMFVDSLRAVEWLQAHRPDAYRVLTERPIQFQYDNDGKLYRFQRPTIVPAERSGHGHTIVNFAPPFQGIQNPHDSRVLYEALQEFHREIHRPEDLLQLRLQPGDCVIFNNRRVLHGRTEFDPASGNRHLKGTYVDMDDFLNQYRVMRRHQGDPYPL